MNFSRFALLLVASCCALWQDAMGYEACWKATYGRGVGTIPDQCPNEEKDGALCYPWCAPGYDGVGPVCWQNCPSGFRDDGAFCFKPDAYGRGAGDTSESKCESKHGPCEKWGLLWYPKCREGFYAFGCCVCSPECPSGMTDIGISCAKDSYGRGAGTLMKCTSDKEYDAGLCYPHCRQGFDGVGPVCWDICPSGTTDCGAMCVTDATSCTDEVLDMIGGTVAAVIDLIPGISVGSVGDAAGELVGAFGYPICPN